MLKREQDSFPTRPQQLPGGRGLWSPSCEPAPSSWSTQVKTFLSCYEFPGYPVPLPSSGDGFAVSRNLPPSPRCSSTGQRLPGRREGSGLRRPRRGRRPSSRDRHARPQRPYRTPRHAQGLGAGFPAGGRRGGQARGEGPERPGPGSGSGCSSRGHDPTHTCPDGLTAGASCEPSASPLTLAPFPWDRAPHTRR